MSDVARSQIADAIERLCDDYLQGDYQEDWDLEALFTQLEQIYPTSYDAEDVAEGEGREALVDKLRDDVIDAYNEREQELGDELMRALERYMLLQIIDNRWREHLHDMDYLREGIHLRGFAQIDPLVAYKNEGFEMFTELMNNIWDEFARYIFNVEVNVEPEQQQAGPQWGLSGQSSSSTGTLNYGGGRSAQGSEAIAAAAGGALAAGVAEPEDEELINPLPVVETRRLEENEKIGRNDPCWCGSGKKFKKCHGA
jgi:preprotein translocase subunit SecA